MKKKYANFYDKQNANFLAPSEFVTRALLAQYPRKKRLQLQDFSRVLDIGFGDGRNFPLFFQLGLRVCGLEIHESIVRSCALRFEKENKIDKLTVGQSHAIPFQDKYFDLVVASHSIYYVGGENVFANISEAKRVLKAGGKLIFSFLAPRSYLLEGCEQIDQWHIRVKSDPLFIRNESKLAVAQSENSFHELLVGFENLEIGRVNADWWGLVEDYWIISAEKSF